MTNIGSTSAALHTAQLMAGKMIPRTKTKADSIERERCMKEEKISLKKSGQRTGKDKEEQK